MSFAKHRNGRLATFQFDFNGSRQRFENEKMLTQDAEFTEIAPERHENTKITRTLPPSQLSLPGEDLPF
jgi:hypothetical protein